MYIYWHKWTDIIVVASTVIAEQNTRTKEWTLNVDDIGIEIKMIICFNKTSCNRAKWRKQVRWFLGESETSVEEFYGSIGKNGTKLN